MKIKRIQDYYDQIQEMYPDVPMHDIKKILQFGWKSLYLHNSYGGDVIIRDENVFIYFGSLMKDSIKWFTYYKRKLATKIKVLFLRRNKNIPWDGYYYFAINKKEEQKYFDSIKKRGRPKKWFTFGPIILYKIKEECIVREAECGLIFRVPYGADLGLHIFKRKFKTDSAEVILQRSNKFKDLLITNNEYEYV